MTTYLRDVIAIPEHSGVDDYVLRLTDGVGRDRLAETVGEYVVTGDITHAFDQALHLVEDALERGTSRAAFLAGSFGSGKSHFMAVLYALLGNEPVARAKAELQPVIAGHDSRLAGRKILRLAYHFVGGKSVEQVLLGGYVTQIQALHPGARLPAVHRSNAVLTDADRLRADLGDDRFFARLNGVAEGPGSTDGATAPTSGDVWRRVLAEEDWTAASYDAARRAAPGSDAQTKLVDTLARSYFTAFTQTAEFVSLDDGLAAISRHAQGLGYDAVVMFLDELVLWLAFQVGNKEFFGREAQKVTKLVESGSGERPVPLVSFVARQIDLRRYFVDYGAGMGAEQDALDNAFRHQEGRFATIKLGDENLPFIAEQRLLRPVSPGAKAELDAAFARLDRQPAIWDVLLDGVNSDENHRGADQASFRRTYPFSPALVDTLRTLASAMQRDRTALKVMQQLLVAQRATLTVDDVVPVGDVFELVVNGSEAITPEMAGTFRNARTLYDAKLRPLLLREHQLDEASLLQLAPTDPRLVAFRRDDRIAKTLLLSAVAPDVPALKDLTAGRLAALNHGSIVSPLPGQQATTVLAKVNRWKVDVPEIRVSGDPRNPVIRCRISEVDYESVIERAKGEDNDGRRRETLKRMVWTALGATTTDADMYGVTRLPCIWRGSRRDVELVFGNIRDRSWLDDGKFEAGSGTWRFVVDYPYDEAGHSARDDLARLDELQVRGRSARTIAWVPRFLSRDRRAELGRLVILDWLLDGPGERWTSHADHLGEADRKLARGILESQQHSLREKLSQALQEAYGAARETPGTLEDDDGHDRVLVSLDPELRPQAPIGHDLGAAFANLVDQAFSTSFPGHPLFEPADKEIRPADLAVVLAAVEKARQRPDALVFIDPPNREAVRRVANPLGVGYMGETNFSFGTDRFPWSNEMVKAMGKAGLAADAPVRVKQVREWVAAVSPPKGLRTEVQDLVICAWAVQQGRAWYRHGGAVPPSKPGSVADDVELRPEPLPSTDEWSRAARRAGLLFGVAPSAYLTGANLAALADAVRAAVGTLGPAARQLAESLRAAYRRFDLEPGASGRLATATAAVELLGRLQAAGTDNVALIQVLADQQLPSTDEATARSLTRASQVITAADAFPWDRLSPLRAGAGRGDDRARAAAAILARVRDALTRDELADELPPALERAQQEAFDWAMEAAALAPAARPAPPVTPPAEPVAGLAHRREIRDRRDVEPTLADLCAFVAQHTEETVVVEWRVGPT